MALSKEIGVLSKLSAGSNKVISRTLDEIIQEIADGGNFSEADIKVVESEFSKRITKDLKLENVFIDSKNYKIHFTVTSKVSDILVYLNTIIIKINKISQELWRGNEYWIIMPTLTRIDVQGPADRPGSRKFNVNLFLAP